jgi:hypothetical protein
MTTPGNDPTTFLLVAHRLRQLRHGILNRQQVQDPRFQVNRRMKVVRLSLLRTGRFYPQECSQH